MPKEDIKEILEGIQANLDKLTPEERLKLLQDLRQQIESVNQDIEKLIQMERD